MSSSSETRLALGLLLALSCASITAAEDPRTLAERAERNASQVAIDVQPGQFDRDRVREDADAALARARKEVARQAAERRARTDVNVTISEQGLQVKAPPDAASKAQSDKPPLAGRLVVAISSSMPEDMVRQYARQLDGVPEAIMVLRGFIGGARTTKPTVEWLERALRKQPQNFQGPHYRVEVVVDPLAFRMLGIHQVPAVTFLPGVQDLRHCDAETLTTTRIAYGAVSVSGALRALAPAITVPASLMKTLGNRT